MSDITLLDANEFLTAVKLVADTKAPMEGARVVLDYPSKGMQVLVAMLLDRSFFELLEELNVVTGKGSEE